MATRRARSSSRASLRALPASTCLFNLPTLVVCVSISSPCDPKANPLFNRSRYTPRTCPLSRLAYEGLALTSAMSNKVAVSAYAADADHPLDSWMPHLADHFGLQIKELVPCCVPNIQRLVKDPTGRCRCNACGFAASAPQESSRRLLHNWLHSLFVMHTQNQDCLSAAGLPKESECLPNI